MCDGPELREPTAYPALLRKALALHEDEQRAGRLRLLAAGQKARIVFITCSDSRISPYLLTGAIEGDLFIIRSAGNHLPTDGEGGEWASLDLALRALPITDVVVCGHSGCAAMGCLVDPGTAPPLAAEHLACLRHLLQPAPVDVDELGRRNVHHQIAGIRRHLAGRGQEVAVHGWFLDLHGPRLEIIDEPASWIARAADAAT